MNADGWTGRWLLIEEESWSLDPDRGHYPVETRVRAKGEDLWMEQDIGLTDGTVLTWVFDGKFDGVMRPLVFRHDGSELTSIAFSLFAQDIGGDSFRTADDAQAGSEIWEVCGDRVQVRGCYFRDSKPYPYRELWRRAD